MSREKHPQSERPVWRPGDGNGDPDPKMIEGSKNLEAGHPTWKLFMGDVPANVTADRLADYVPRYCYLDDNAVWAVSKISDLQKHDRCRYWPYDFTEKAGNISTARRNCGRPAYNRFKKLASIQKSKGRRYWLCGSGALEVSIPQSAPAVKEEGENGRASTTSEPSETTDPSIESSAEPSTDTTQEKTPAEAELQKESKKQTPEEPRPEPRPKPTKQPEERTKDGREERAKEQPGDKPKEQPKEQQEDQANESEEEEETPQVDPDAKALLPVQSRTPLAESDFAPGFSNSSTPMPFSPHYPSLMTGDSSSTTPFTDHPKAPSSSSSSSSKRSASPSGTPTPSKRQRSRLQPYTLPPEVEVRDDELTLLQSRVTKLQGRNARLEDDKRGLSLQVAHHTAKLHKYGDTLTNTRKERDAFRQAATALRTYILDKQDELVECHRYCVGTVEREKELHRLVGEHAALAKKALKPLESLHRGLGQLVDDQEEWFREAGLERVWEDSMGEEEELR